MRCGERRNVRILLVGDRYVGKTSLILSLVSEEFPEDVPAKAEEITIPADLVPEMVPTNIVDYSAGEQTEDQMREELRKAHVVCLVYSASERRSFARLTNHWLPLLRDALPSSKTPIILVCNKADLSDESSIEAAEEVMQEYPEIESFVETSAKTLKNVSEMFYYAQKSVLHPTAPVYITETQELTEECKKALTRVFRVCDADNDGLLNDKELNAFQRRCFDNPLKPEAMEDVKAILRKNIAGGVSPNNCVTLTGFLFLHCLFIRRGRSHTTWTVLRKFGYNEQLHLSKEYLNPAIKIPNGSTTELSHKGQSFFTKLFKKHDKDRDGALSPIELGQLFSVCPMPAWEGDSISRLVMTNENGWVTLPGFLCYWNWITVNDVTKTFEYLAYFAYSTNDYESQLSAVQITRERKLDLLKKQSTRNVYVCHVIGAPGVGKSCVVRGNIGQSRESITDNIRGPQVTVNKIHVYGQEKYLVMKEIHSRNPSEALSPLEAQCDVVCFVYDTTNPKSFEYCARLYSKHFEDGKCPALVVCCKSDSREVRQDYLVQPAAFCDARRLPPPHKFCSSQLQGGELYQKLATMAAFPHLTELSLYGDSVLWKAGLGIALVTAVGLIVMRLIQTERR